MICGLCGRLISEPMLVHLAEAHPLPADRFAGTHDDACACGQTWTHFPWEGPCAAPMECLDCEGARVGVA